MFPFIAVLTAVTFDLKMKLIYKLIIVQGITDPFTPKGGQPSGSEAFARVIRAILSWALFFGMAVGLVMTVAALIMAAWSKRYVIQDAKTPALVFLICAGFFTLVQLVWTVFNGVISAA